MVELLIENGADITVRRFDNQQTSFDIVNQMKNLKLLKILHVAKSSKKSNEKSENDVIINAETGTQPTKAENTTKTENNTNENNTTEDTTKIENNTNENNITENTTKTEDTTKIEDTTKTENTKKNIEIREKEEAFLRNLDRERKNIEQILNDKKIDFSKNQRECQKKIEILMKKEKMNGIKEEFYQVWQKERQELIEEIAKMKNDLHRLEDQTSPIRTDYKKKEKLFTEIETIKKTENLRIFYDTICQKLSGKFLSAILILEGLIQRSPSLSEKVTCFRSLFFVLNFFYQKKISKGNKRTCYTSKWSNRRNSFYWGIFEFDY